MAFWNKTSQNQEQFAGIEEVLFDKKYQGGLNGFLKRVIRDSLSLEYQNLDEEIKDSLFNNFRYYHGIISPFQSLIINILGKKGTFYVVNHQNLKEYVPYKSPINHFTKNYIIGYSEKYKGSKENAIDYNLDYFPLSQYEYVFHIQEKIFKNMLGAINLSNKPVLKIENGAESIENVEAFKIKINQVLESMYVDKKSIIYMGSNDSIDITMVDFDNYVKAFKVLDGQIARLSGFPLTYIQGGSPHSFASSLEGERIAEEKALMNFSKHIILPLLQEIQNQFGSGRKIKLQPPIGTKMFEVKALAQVLNTIENCQNISTEEKNSLKKQYLNI